MLRLHNLSLNLRPPQPQHQLATSITSTSTCNLHNLSLNLRPPQPQHQLATSTTSTSTCGLHTLSLNLRPPLTLHNVVHVEAQNGDVPLAPEVVDDLASLDRSFLPALVGLVVVGRQVGVGQAYPTALKQYKTGSKILTVITTL